MSSSSRGPRLQVVDEKKSARPKAPKKKKSSAPKLSAVQLAECTALNKALQEYNAGRSRAERLTDIRLARIAASFGGSSYDSQWWAYRNGAKALPEIDKLIVCWQLDRRPQDLFEWKFSDWTPLKPSRLQLLANALAKDNDK